MVEEDIPEFSEIFPQEKVFPDLERVDIDSLLNKKIIVEDFVLRPSQFREGDFAIVKFREGNESKVFLTGSEVLVKQLKKSREIGKIPFKATIQKVPTDKDRAYYTFV
jgi:hypothetical protein